MIGEVGVGLMAVVDCSFNLDGRCPSERDTERHFRAASHYVRRVCVFTSPHFVVFVSALCFFSFFHHHLLPFGSFKVEKTELEDELDGLEANMEVLKEECQDLASQVFIHASIE